ncbi:ABC transporter A like protein [Aduncisulcus paluster]|uniref:ABC transporter A like protein n=2 Tax=Aduncisulcus paluster TaxID=2918883 RepID=A0ABQ5K8G6_9EUKA|nr:ABC transporter A like protein [Aduncisulcus paluster]
MEAIEDAETANLAPLEQPKTKKEKYLFFHSQFKGVFIKNWLLTGRSPFFTIVKIIVPFLAMGLILLSHHLMKTPAIPHQEVFDEPMQFAICPDETRGSGSCYALVMCIDDDVDLIDEYRQVWEDIVTYMSENNDPPLDPDLDVYWYETESEFQLAYLNDGLLALNSVKIGSFSYNNPIFTAYTRANQDGQGVRSTTRTWTYNTLVKVYEAMYNVFGKYHMFLIEEDVHLHFNWNWRDYPVQSISDNDSTMYYVITMFAVVGILIPFALQVIEMANEKESQVRQGLAGIGLRYFANDCAWFVYYLIIQAYNVTVFILLGKLTDMSFFTDVTFSALWTLLMFFAVAITAWGLMAAAFCTTLRGSLIGVIILFTVLMVTQFILEATCTFVPTTNIPLIRMIISAYPSYHLDIVSYVMYATTQGLGRNPLDRHFYFKDLFYKWGSTVNNLPITVLPIKNLLMLLVDTAGAWLFSVYAQVANGSSSGGSRGWGWGFAAISGQKKVLSTYATPSAGLRGVGPAEHAADPLVRDEARLLAIGETQGYAITVEGLTKIFTKDDTKSTGCCSCGWGGCCCNGCCNGCCEGCCCDCFCHGCCGLREHCEKSKKEKIHKKREDEKLSISTSLLGYQTTDEDAEDSYKTLQDIEDGKGESKVYIDDIKKKKSSGTSSRTSSSQGSDEEDSDSIGVSFSDSQAESRDSQGGSKKKQVGSRILEDGSVLALDKVFFGVKEGECCALLGRNGSGKTTCINIMNGTIIPSSGSAYVLGHSVLTDIHNVHRLTGVCPQFDILWPQLTAEEHMHLFCLFRGKLNEEERAKEVKTMLHHTSLTEHAHKRVKHMSGGMKRRLSVSLALIAGPRIIILDEPTTGLDPISRRKIWRLLARMKKGRVLLLTTHSMSEAEELGDRIVILQDGSVKGMGSVQRMKRVWGGGYRIVMETKQLDKTKGQEGKKKEEEAEEESISLVSALSRVLEPLFPTCEISIHNTRVVLTIPPLYPISRDDIITYEIRQKRRTGVDEVFKGLVMGELIDILEKHERNRGAGQLKKTEVPKKEEEEEEEREQPEKDEIEDRDREIILASSEYASLSSQIAHVSSWSLKFTTMDDVFRNSLDEAFKPLVELDNTSRREVTVTSI